MFYSVVIISNFCLDPVPLQWIFVVIETEEIYLSNPVQFSKLGGHSHVHKTKLSRITIANYCKFGFKFL